MSVLTVLDETAAPAIEWTPEDDAAVEAARAKFAAAKADGYLAYKVAEAPDEKGDIAREVIHEFDATAAKIVMSPQTQGG
jgi:hypothetical protein